MNFSVVVAVNDEKVLTSCLLASPDLRKSTEVCCKRHCASAAVAYNEGLGETTGEVVVFPHQDLFLPEGWIGHFESALRWLENADPHWGVLGVCGISKTGRLHGWVYSTGLGRVVGGPFPAPQEVRTLDEVLLVVRRSSGIRFDQRLPGFHMYGTDLCLEAEKRGLRNYVVPCFAIHNSNGIKSLPLAFWKAYLHVRRKWQACLPVYSPCADVTRSLVPVARQIVSRWLRLNIRRRSAGTRVADAAALHHQLERAGDNSGALWGIRS